MVPFVAWGTRSMPFGLAAAMRARLYPARIWGRRGTWKMSGFSPQKPWWSWCKPILLINISYGMYQICACPLLNSWFLAGVFHIRGKGFHNDERITYNHIFGKRRKGVLDVNSGLVWGVDIFIVVQSCSTHIWDGWLRFLIMFWDG